jgi:hypothetical protein
VFKTLGTNSSYFQIHTKREKEGEEQGIRERPLYMAKKKHHLLKGSQALPARPSGGGGSDISVSPHSIILPLLHTHFIYT